MRINDPDTFQFSFPNKIHCFEICGNEFAVNLICAVTEREIILGQIKVPDNDGALFEWEVLKNIYHEYQSHAICFAPETSLVTKTVKFCVAGRVLCIYRTDLNNSDTVQVVEDSHSNYINDVQWQHQGNYLASVSDDHTCKVWDADSNFENVIAFCLSSPGMSVRWHPEEPHKLMVAEKKGIVRLYNVRTQQAIISVETPKWPLMSADWSLANRNHITALTNELLTWDLRYPCALRNKQVNEKCGRVVRYAPHSEAILATVGYPQNTLKVYKSNVLLLEVPLKLYGGLAWHTRLPYVAAASDNKLCFWKIQMK